MPGSINEENNVGVALEDSLQNIRSYENESGDGCIVTIMSTSFLTSESIVSFGTAIRLST